MFHPWRALRELGHVIVEWVRPHSDAVAATDGKRVIWLDPRMNQVERRCVLTHELVHLEYGHHGCQPGKVEHLVRTEAARYLIDIRDLRWCALWALSLPELADELWVTDMVLHDRLTGLTEEEACMLPDGVRRYARRVWAQK